MNEAVMIAEEKFSTRQEVVEFIEQEASTAVEKALAETHRQPRRVPWATSGPVGKDSQGYSIEGSSICIGLHWPGSGKGRDSHAPAVEGTVSDVWIYSPLWASIVFDSAGHQAPASV
ncbi:MAG: hypothetical protein R3B84_23565 [Zavarzinella sp.]